jgi:hypothetical protein
MTENKELKRRPIKIRRKRPHLLKPEKKGSMPQHRQYFLLVKHRKDRNPKVPAGGAAATAPKGVALASPPALTPTSTWWAFVTL